MFNYKRLLNTCVILLICIFYISGCKPGEFRALYAEGWLKRPVIVTVTDEFSSKVIEGAEVKIVEPDYMQNLFADPKIEKKYEQVTDDKGKAELLIWFGFNSETRFGVDNGRFALSGSGSEWEGYLIISEDTPNKVGAFKFSGTDSDGLTGTVVTDGELFLVDTTKPVGVSEIKAMPEEDGDILLEWYYDGEEVELFNIYRSLSEDVGYTDYYDTVKALDSKIFGNK